MKRMCYLILCLPLLASLTANASGQQRGNAAPSIPIARGTEADRGDAIAAGFVGVKNGHLWRDGERVRLWGINVVSEYGRSKEEQARILDRLKATGFNAVRLHLYDDSVVPEGDPGYRVPTYVKGDDSAMDRLDHFLHAAAERGMLLYMTLERRRMPILASSYDLVPADEHEAEWKAAVEASNASEPHQGAWIEQVWPLDARLEQVYTTYVRNLLAHRNLYSGATYAEDPAIAMWEISNETSYIAMMLDGSSTALKGFWGKGTQKRWNQFLRDHYKTPSSLLAAWGQLEEGESLDEGTIAFAPVPPPVFSKPFHEEATYPSRRVRDLITFAVNSYVEGNNRVLAAIRASAPAGVGAAVVPVGYDTHYQENLLDMYCASAGNLSIAGNYTWLRTYDTSDPTYPFTSLLAAPPAFYGMDLGRITGKPTVTYEINIHKPYPYRVEFPLVVASYASARNWDGVFWYYWSDSKSAPPADYTELHSHGITYSTTSNAWGGVNIETDEILLGAIRVAGTIFRNGALRASAHPARIVVGPDELIWSYADMGPWMKLVRSAVRTHGAEIDFRASDEGKVDIDRPFILPKTSKLGPDVAIHHDKRQMYANSPTVKMFVGWPDAEKVTFSDGFALEGLVVGQFIAFAMVSDDGKPLTSSRRLLLTALATGENTGFKYDPQATSKTGWYGMLESLVSYGTGPAEITWPSVKVKIGDRQGECVRFNALPQAMGRERVSGEVVLDGKAPTAWVEVACP